MNRLPAASTHANSIDWEGIQSLLRVVRNHGFAGAARDKGVSRSAIHKQIGALEKQMGVELLIRSTRPPRLTEAGKAICAAAEQFDQAIVAAVGDAGAARLNMGDRIALLARRTAAIAEDLASLADEAN